MVNFNKTQDIVKEMNRKVLGGAKIPHSCSLPVLRKVDGEYVIALFIQLIKREQLRNGEMQRPEFWCYADIKKGDDFKEFDCQKIEFSTASYDQIYKKGNASKAATTQDVFKLYSLMDGIRKNYIESGIIDAFFYKKYMEELYKLVPKGQIRFYQELSKLI